MLPEVVVTSTVTLHPARGGVVTTCIQNILLSTCFTQQEKANRTSSTLEDDVTAAGAPPMVTVVLPGTKWLPWIVTDSPPVVLSPSATAVEITGAV